MVGVGNRNAELNRSILKDLNILKNNYAKKRTIRGKKKEKINPTKLEKANIEVDI